MRVKSINNVPTWLVDAVSACQDSLNAQSWSAAALHLIALGLHAHLSSHDAPQEAIDIVTREIGSVDADSIADATRPGEWGGGRR